MVEEKRFGLEVINKLHDKIIYLVKEVTWRKHPVLKAILGSNIRSSYSLLRALIYPQAYYV